ncbi:hypothetical protein FRC12_000284 [Ceratobasidium sp. 428]|nr:hypothetical protein FRC12_000284 [Ceratobasidium sp. 428]
MTVGLLFTTHISPRRKSWIIYGISTQCTILLQRAAKVVYEYRQSPYATNSYCVAYGRYHPTPRTTTVCGTPVLEPRKPTILLSVHDALPVWHRFSVFHSRLSFAPLEPRKRDVVRARPTQPALPEAFDTVLIKHNSGKFGLPRYRATRVRAIFGAPAQFPHLSSHRLVYLELFTPFPASPSPFHRMHATERQLRSNGKRHCIVVPISNIVMSCHLAPNFQTLQPTTQLPTSINSLSLARRFWFNPYYNHFSFRLCEYWRRVKAWQ